MNVAIFGCGKTGREIKRLLEQYRKDVSVKYYCDNNKSVQGMIVDSLCVIPLVELQKRYRNKEIDAVLLGLSFNHYEKIKIQLEELGMERIYVVPTYLRAKEKFDDRDRNNLMTKIEDRKPELLYLEFHVADQCNLNCKGCTHFSNLVEMERYADLIQFKKDMKRLRELFENIITIRILGGEPLLNKELPQFIKTTRDTFPYSNLCIVTNGLLLKQMEPDLIASIKTNDVLVNVSIYKPLYGKVRDMEEHLESLGIRYEMSEPCDEFLKFITLNKEMDEKESFNSCPRNGCVFLKDGYISSCCMPQLIMYFNRYFNKDLPEKEGIHIHEEGLNGFELRKRLKMPMKICRYCTEDTNFTWEQAGIQKKLEDWCV